MGAAMQQRGGGLASYRQVKARLAFSEEAFRSLEKNGFERTARFADQEQAAGLADYKQSAALRNMREEYTWLH